MTLSPLTAFALAARAHDDVLDLEGLAVGVARMGNPEVDARAVARRLDEIAAAVAEHLPAGAPPDRTVAHLRRVLVHELGFTGDRDAPRTAEDSFLDRVLERRRGLPILLSVVWILVGERLGLPVRGVNFPGHFLICFDAPGARIYLDPFHGGVAREAGDLLGRLGPRSPDRRVLEPCGVRPIVGRMLANLKNLWVDESRYAEALGAVDRILLIGGEIPAELRDRGLLCLHVGKPEEAARDFRRYLKLQPDAEDRSVVEALLQKIQEAG